MHNALNADAAAISERLRAEGVDVIRVSYPDLIGVDRGRDVLLDELSAATGHGLEEGGSFRDARASRRLSRRLG